jgi:adenylate cyclase
LAVKKLLLFGAGEEMTDIALFLEPLPPTFFNVRDPPITAIEVRAKEILRLPVRGDLIAQIDKIRLLACGLNTIPDGLSSFVNVVTLVLAENDIQSIPELALTPLTFLETLDLSHNRLTRLDCGLPESIQTLSLSFNPGFEIASIWAKSLPALVTLKVTHCGIASLPDDPPAWADGLRSLNLDGNGLQEVPPVVSRLPHLDELFLLANRIRNVDGLALPQHFKILNLAFNRFKSFRPAPDLRTQSLDLSFNAFRDVPSDLLSLTSLRIISLNHCKLGGELDFELPANVLALDVSHNNIDALSERLVASMGHLLTLRIASNQIVAIANCFPEQAPLQNFIGDRNRLEALPPNLMLCRRLELFSCCSCKLRTLPRFNLPQLRQFLIAFNEIEEIPDDFEPSTFLSALNVSFNRLADLPRSLRACRKMSSLTAVCNKFVHVPRVVFSFSQLKILSLSGNLLVTVSSDLQSLRFLQTLDLSNNHLTECPQGITSLGSLRHLSLSHNVISSFDLEQLPANLALFDISYNLIGAFSIPIPQTASISVDYNQIKTLDPSLFTAAHFLSVSGNPLKDRLLDKLPELLRTTSLRFIECLGNESTELPPLPIHVLDNSNASFPDSFGVGYAATQGRRPTMEDSVIMRRLTDTHFLCGVFDGHHGHVAAVTAAHCLPNEIQMRMINSHDALRALAGGIAAVNERLRTLQMRDGCTAACAFVVPGSVIACGVGDSRVVRVTRAGCVRLTTDTKPTERAEYKRLRASDVIIDAGGRIDGKLAVSRALGDFAFGDALFVEPEVAAYEVGPDDVGFVVACDGLWDVICDERAADVVRQAVTATDAAVTLKNFAFALGTGDNVSVIVGKFDVEPGDRGLATRHTVERLPARGEEEEEQKETLPATTALGRRRKRT